MPATRFIFVEGLMGAGKSTMVERIVESLLDAGQSAVAVWEGPTVKEPDQPLRLSPTLPHPFAPWEDLTIEAYVEESLRRWRHFIDEHADDRRIIVCDGLLFHGNMTDLMLMRAPYPVLCRYVLDVLGVLEPLRPVAIYLRGPDVAQALDEIIAERGESWQRYQVDWKVDSPYGWEHGLDGLSGLVELYTNYRKLCHQLIEALPIPILCVDRTSGWNTVYQGVAALVGIPVENNPTALSSADEGTSRLS